MFDSLVKTSPYATKSVKAEFKADGGPGEFTALFSVFDVLDYQGDIIRKGAFSTALENDPNPPVVYSHRWDIPPIGKTIDWDQVEQGARGHGKLFVDEHETAKPVYAGMRDGALKEFSFAYDIADGGYILREAEDGEKSPRWDDMIREISDLSRVFEWGPTIAGANPSTELISGPKALEAMLGAKGAADLRTLLGLDDDDPESKKLAKALEDLTGYKAGARNSSKDSERLQSIHDLAVENGAKCAEPDSGDDPEKSGDPERKRAVEELLSAGPAVLS